MRRKRINRIIDRESIQLFFLKTGCLITANDSDNDDLVHPECLPNYVVPAVSFASPLNKFEEQEAPISMCDDHPLEKAREVFEIDDGNE